VTTALLVSVIVLWLVVLAMAGVIVALARQVGVLHERLAPVGALTIGADPVIGKAAPRVKAATLSGSSLEIGVPLASGSAQLLLFVAPDCPVCKKIIPLAQSFARRERLEVLYVGDGDLGEQRQLSRQFEIDLERFVTGAQIGMAFRVGKVPYGVLLDPKGAIAAMGLVNSREHLDSLMVAHETGYPSIQSYLSANKITSLEA
jgi:methylamine dehydrogenase accessory protein MauD